MALGRPLNWPSTGSMSQMVPGVDFVGRAAELGVLATQLDQVSAGRARIVLIQGPAGVGKTSLVRQFLRNAVGMRLIAASGDESERCLPFGLVDQFVRRGTQLIGEVAPRMSSGTDPLDVGAELLALFGALQHDEPLVLVVDDGHWADDPSLYALTFAVRRLYADRVLTLVTVRDVTYLPEGLRRAAAGERGRVLTLGGLGLEELTLLAVRRGFGPLPRRAVKRLRDHTDGNPLHALALLDELAPEVLRSPGAELPAPRSFAVLVLSRLAACAPAAQELTLAASVLGDHCALDVVAKIARLEDPIPALDEAISAGLLREQWEPRSSGCVLAFPHPLVRRAIYRDLGPARRSDLHNRAAAVLDGVASLDHRARAALVQDPILASDLEARANDEATAGAMASAAEHLLASARLSIPADRARRLLDGARLLALNGDAALATTFADELVTLPDSPRRRLVLGHLAMVAGHHEDGKALLSEAWNALRLDPDAVLAAHTAAQLADVCMAQGRGSETVTWARRALAATLAGSPSAVPALSRLMVGLTLSGEAEQALTLASPAVSSVGDGLLPCDVDALLGRGLVQLWTDDLVGARVDLSAVVDAARARHQLRDAVIALRYLAEAEYRLGNWDESIVHAELAVSIAEDSDQAWLLPFTYAMPVYPLAARGQQEQAAVLAEAASVATDALDQSESAVTAHAATAAAFLSFVAGDPSAVDQATSSILALRGRDFSDEPGLVAWRELYADALVDLGRLDEADEILASYQKLAAARRRRSSLAAAARVRAKLHVARGEPRKAGEAFGAALDHAERVPAPFDQALIQQAYGHFLRRTGQRRRAAAQLMAARDTFARLGARPFTDRADRELAALGLAPARRTEPDAARLTPQELATAQLVAAGATNREAAAELVLSIKTVEYHLSRAYTKLGIGSRHQLGGRLSADRNPG
jgi:ATP/maltotriose-dependent transcriptional regulator MalT